MKDDSLMGLQHLCSDSIHSRVNVVVVDGMSFYPIVASVKMRQIRCIYIGLVLQMRILD